MTASFRALFKSASFALLLLAAFSGPTLAQVGKQADKQERFATAEAAADTLTEAIRKNDDKKSRRSSAPAGATSFPATRRTRTMYVPVSLPPGTKTTRSCPRATTRL